MTAITSCEWPDLKQPAHLKPICWGCSSTETRRFAKWNTYQQSSPLDSSPQSSLTCFGAIEMTDYQKGYDARQDGEPMNYSKSSDWQCGWYAAESEINSAS